MKMQSLRLAEPMMLSMLAGEITEVEDKRYSNFW